MLITGLDENEKASYFLSIKNETNPFGGVWDGESILYQTLQENIKMNSNQWYHLAVVFDNGSGSDASLEFYENGEPVYEENSLQAIDENSFPAKTTLLIGAGICAGKGYGFSKKMTLVIFSGAG